LFNTLIIQKSMKKFFMFLAVVGLIAISAQYVSAQTPDSAATTTTTAVAPTAAPAADQTVQQETPIHQQIKAKFIEGGPGFMASILLCLILGLAIAIERIIYLNMASTNTEKLLKKIEDALATGGVEAAKDVCRNTKGPVASIFYQGLCRADDGVEMVEKSVSSYGSIQMTQLESGLTWINLFIALAPMLGFLGTVVGLVIAFDDIQTAGDISPNIVAGGMKVALITTVGGLIVAIILQLFYSYIVSKIDSIVLSMEDASISLIDILVKAKK
jgi:biopolymer transport protein ExbB